MRFCCQLKRQPRTLEFYRWGLAHLEAGCAVLPEDHHPILAVLANDRLGPESRYDLERALRRFFRWASNEFSIPNPMLQIERTRLKKKLPRVLSRSEIGAVWAACRDGRDRALIGLFLDTGLRVGGGGKPDAARRGRVFAAGFRESGGPPGARLTACP